MNLNLENYVHYFFIGESTDMRKGIYSLYALIKTHSKLSAVRDDANVLLSVSRKYIKI